MTRLSTVREGAALLAEILKSADMAHGNDGKTNTQELNETLANEGYTQADRLIVKAPKTMHRYAQRVGQSKEPSYDAIDQAVKNAVKAAEKAAAKSGDPDKLSAKEMKTLAPTFQNLVRFAIAYKDKTLDALFF
jgi:hypothetical protein